MLFHNSPYLKLCINDQSLVRASFQDCHGGQLCNTKGGNTARGSLRVITLFIEKSLKKFLSIAEIYLVIGFDSCTEVHLEFVTCIV